MRQRKSRKDRQVAGGAPPPCATSWTYAGLFFVALATLMHEVVLTRIFSVTLSYHFAFAVISVAMFGMTAGAMLVHLFPRMFPRAGAAGQMATSALLFSVSAVASFIMHLYLPWLGAAPTDRLSALIPSYLVMSVPFIFSGICVCLALTRFPDDVGRLYAADLAGAAAGCVVPIAVLRVTDGPGAVLVAALLVAVGAALFAREGKRSGSGATSAAWALGLAFLAVVQTQQGWSGSPPLRLHWVRGHEAPAVLYEKWNSFSRVTVEGDPDALWRPSGWGLSPAYPADRPVRELNLWIDSAAGTTLTAFDGRADKLEHLKYDIVNLANFARPGADVLVIGSGGGRDVLSALAFGQKSVVAVEINEDILEAVNQRFGDFTGHLDRLPNVTFVNDEARSFAARESRRFGIIQISLIDTWAATAAGAFVLAENSLYTTEAWRIFLDRLAPRGVLTCSRWYFKDRPAEMYRLTSLANEALMRAGVAHPRDHLFLSRLMLSTSGDDHPDGVGTLLMSKQAFSDADLDTMESVAERMGFEVVLSRRTALDPTFVTLSSGAGAKQLLGAYPLDISAPTDDKPFFFHMLRLGNLFDGSLRPLLEESANKINLRAVRVMGALLIMVGLLALLFILLPLALASGALRSQLSGGAWPLMLYFAGIGFGFMLVEISQMQRIMIFLGHPTYALAVVLFTLLLSGGAGSFISGRFPAMGRMRPAPAALVCLLGALTLAGLATPRLAETYQGASTPIRIAVSALLLAVPGVLMGMPFPMGMRLAAARPADMTAWLWGVNGATSVCASVLAVAIALTWGISSAFWAGVSCYALSLLAGLMAQRSRIQGAR